MDRTQASGAWNTGSTPVEGTKKEMFDRLLTLLKSEQPPKLLIFYCL